MSVASRTGSFGEALLRTASGPDSGPALGQYTAVFNEDNQLQKANSAYPAVIGPNDPPVRQFSVSSGWEQAPSAGEDARTLLQQQSMDSPTSNLQKGYSSEYSPLLGPRLLSGGGMELRRSGSLNSSDGNKDCICKLGWACCNWVRLTCC